MRRTVALIRQLKAFGPLPRRRAMPRQQPPTALALAYFDAIEEVIAPARAAVLEVLPDIEHALAAVRRRAGHADASRGPGRDVSREYSVDASGIGIGLGRAAQLGAKAREREQRALKGKAGAIGLELEAATREGAAARVLIDGAAARFARKFRPQALHDVARQFGRRTSRHQRDQLDRQVRAAMGIGLEAIERPTVDRIEGWAALNVDLIVTVPERYFDRLRLDVIDAFAAGAHPTALARDLEDAYGIAQNDARRIARDQVSKLAAQVNQDRQQALGVTGYTWRTMRDNRVRDEHAILEGERFSWSDSPPDGHPGEAILCRCYAEPDLEPVIAGAA